MIKRIWNQLSEIGISPTFSREERRNMMLTNQINGLVFLVATLAGFGILLLKVSGLFEGAGILYFRFWLFSILALVNMVFMRVGMHRFAKLNLTFLVPFLALVAPFFETIDPAQMLWIPVVGVVHPVFPHLLFNRSNERGWFRTGVFYGLAFIWISTVITTSLLANAQGVESWVVVLDWVRPIRLTLFWLMINFGYQYFHRVFQNSEQLLSRSLEEIKLKNEQITEQNQAITKQNDLLSERSLEIAEKNDELIKKSESVRRINEKLEYTVQERTHELELQNKHLAEYAYINAHLLRGPLCRVQGLVYLMEVTEKFGKDDPMYHHLKESMDEFEDVIKKINQLVEEGGHFNRADFDRLGEVAASQAEEDPS